MDATYKTPAGGPGLHDYTHETHLLGQLYGNRAAERSMRDGYSGTTPPATPRASRDAFTIASELADAADTLGDLSERIASGAYDARALTAAEALLIGCGRLVCELRQRGGVTP